MQTPPAPRRPGELAFHLAVLLASLFLFVTAVRISGLEALSAPGTVPMATTGLMVVTSAMVLAQSLRKPGRTSETLWRQILPLPVVGMAALILAYALALKPVGFLPVTLAFLLLSVRALSRRGWGWSALVALVATLGVWVVFRLVFTVLMPPGLVPEAEIVQFFRNL